MIVTHKAFLTRIRIVGVFQITNLFHREKSGDFSPHLLSCQR